MIVDNFCCIGAELQKRDFSQYSSPQIYYYRSASDEETLDVMLSDNFFNPINEKVNKDDIIFMYSIEDKSISWAKVVSNQGGIVKIEPVRINGESVYIKVDEFKTITENNLQNGMQIVDEYISKIIPMLNLFGARTNIFEMSADLQPLNQDVLGQKQYTNITTDKFTRIPVKTYGEDEENIAQDTVDFQFLQVGSLVVDTFGTLGIVEVLEGDVEYTNISITTLIMGNTANKTTDFISPINDTNKGLTNNEANTSVSADNKIATMTEINAVVNGNYLGKSYWFGKTTAGFIVPTPTISKQNYIDFITNEIYVAKEDLSGWDLKETITPQNTEMILITSSFWDIPENGYPGTAIYSDTTSWSYFPRKAGRGDNITITEKQPDGALTVVKDYFGFRKENTAYEVGDKVACAYHPDLMLECGVAGTTSNTELDTRGQLSTGNTIIDGTVTWNVVDIGSGGGLEVGDIGISPFVDEGKNLRRLLNGQVILQSQFAGFATKLKKAVQTYPNLATTEDNWQAIKSNSKIGQCGKFVIDDTAGTIRLPRIVKLQGLLDLSNIGSIVDDGLPSISHTHTRGNMNITGFFGATDIIGDVNGAFYTRALSQLRGDYKGASINNNFNFGFDASKSWTGATSTNSVVDSVYGKSNTVQEEAIQYPYFIQVANGVEEEINITTEIQLNNPFSLGDYKWSEVEIENLSWLKSDGGFKDGTVYPSYYDWILANANTGKELFKKSTDTYTDYDWVVNTVDNTFRLPIKTKTASGNAVVGNGMTLGFTDGTKNYGLNGESYGGANNALGALTNNYGVNVGSAKVGESIGTVLTLGITTDPTKSGIETSDNGLYLYFYVGETVQDANLINAANIANRVHQLSDSYISGLGMPSSRFVDLTLGASGSFYVAPANGWFCVSKVSTNDKQYINLINSSVEIRISAHPAEGEYGYLNVQARKGDIVFVHYTLGGVTEFFRFIYTEGEN